MKRLIYLLFVIGLCACSGQQGNKVYTAFQETDSLTASVHQIPPIMLNPKGLFLMDSFLVVFNDEMDTCFQVYDRENLNYRYSFGIHGSGPKDFNMPSGDAVAANSHEVVLVDGNRLTSISFAEGHPVVNRFKTLKQKPYYNGLLLLGDSTYVCDGDFEDDKEFLFILPNDSTRLMVDYPESIERFGSKLDRNQAYGHINAARPSGDRFASFYTSDRHFRIIDKDGNLLKDVRLEIPPFDPQIPLDPEQRRIHTLSAFATQDYIYTLNLDMTPEEIYAQKGTPSIQVFSWEGEPLRQYHLDRFISSFTVDEAKGLIYGAFANIENEIYTFQMK